MESILEQLARAARERVAADKGRIPPDEMRRRAAAAPPAPSLRDALAAPGMSFICECKKASPSKGLIAPDYDPVAIARGYESAGAAAISVLTEPTRFLGSDEHLRAVASAVSVPVLRKDFVVDDYQVLQARALGAAAVLLICTLHDAPTLERRLGLCADIGIDALVEAHDADEVRMAVGAGARIVGVNNRSLADFTVDFGNSLRLRSLVPAGTLFVTESGVRTAGDIALLAEGGVDAVLVGEALMRASDKRAMLEELRGGAGAPGGGSRDRVDGQADGSGQRHAALAAVTRNRLASREGVLVKVCGLRTEADVGAVNAARPDLAGFILSPGFRRSIPLERLRPLVAKLDPGIGAVGVFVDEPIDNIAPLLGWEEGLLAAVQLHGDEDNAYIAELRRAMVHPGWSPTPVIQAFEVHGPDDVARALESSAELILLDGGKGAGRTFDWGLLEGIDRPFVLAGGLGPDNVAEAVARLHPFGVDMSSGVETGGSKDAGKVARAVALARGVGGENR